MLQLSLNPIYGNCKNVWTAWEKTWEQEESISN